MTNGLTYMDQENLDKVTIALAGLFQAVSLIGELTQTGRLHDDMFDSCIYSIFQTEPKDVVSVWGGYSQIKLGLEKIVQTFDVSAQPDPLQHRYLLSIIHLQKKLSHSPRLLHQLSNRLKQIQKQVDYFSL
jgi:high frequency lysogenization protein